MRVAREGYVPVQGASNALRHQAGRIAAVWPASLFRLFFFFQAEDGIRDLTVTGVQTCALPICPVLSRIVDNLLPARLALAVDRGVVASHPPLEVTQDPLTEAARVHLGVAPFLDRSEEHTSELQSQSNLVCRLLLEKKKNNAKRY